MNEIIKEYTVEIEPNDVKTVTINNGVIDITFSSDGETTWVGALQGVLLDDQGETIGYKVYTY